jgi:hypothetical protein
MAFDEALEFYYDAVHALRFMAEHLGDLNAFFATLDDMSAKADPTFSFSMVSDSFVISSEKPNWTIPTMFQVAQYAALAGVAVRGALSYGRHFERLEGPHHLLLSEAFTRAYELESQCARVPRVILDPEQLTTFQAFYDLDREYVGSPILLQCDDNYWCINTLPFQYDYSAINAAVGPVEGALANSIRPEVRAKSSWLGDYLNVVLWGRNGVYESLGQESFRTYVRQNVIDGLAVRTWKYQAAAEPRFVLLHGGETEGHSHPFTRSFAENVHVRGGSC